jgi:hypothetical protein
VKSHGRCRIGGRHESAAGEIPLLPSIPCLSLHERIFSTLVGRARRPAAYARQAPPCSHVSSIRALYSLERQSQLGSLAGAAHPLNHNVGVLRSTQCGQKPHVEHKGTCLLDLAFQYEEKR